MRQTSTMFSKNWLKILEEKLSNEITRNVRAKSTSKNLSLLIKDVVKVVYVYFFGGVTLSARIFSSPLSTVHSSMSSIIRQQ
mmetsp:Transcript_43556/g.50116  ORF Transcript_43556/g.50116 Transcript_43556/m.50116 type:complete len:82 (+) Transcript_43556:603-848(+)